MIQNPVFDTMLASK